MGCVSSVFQFGSYLVHEGAEATEESKEDGVSSSPSLQETTAVDYSKVPEVPSHQFSAPLAQEEDCILQTKDATSEKARKDDSKGSEEKVDVVKPQDPEERELQRIHESKVEKEKTVDNSGCTTEKTVYSQFTESMKIQESKGPAVDPFSSSSQTVFPPFKKSWHEDKLAFSDSQKSAYVHSVTVEDSQALPSKPAPVDLLSTNLYDKTPTEPAKSVSELIKEVEPVVSLAAEKIEEFPEIQPGENISDAEEIKNLEQLTAEVQGEEEDGDYQREDVADAVVKIQAGVRGYLTRKALKENRKNDNFDDLEPQMVSENLLLTDDNALVEAFKETVNASIDEMDESSENVGEHDAAVRIQAMYRGYRTRKQLDDGRSVSPNPEFESSEAAEEIQDLTIPKADKVSPNRSPVIVTENFVPILSQKIVFTPPPSPTIEKRREEYPLNKEGNDEQIIKESTDNCSDSEFNNDLVEMCLPTNEEFTAEDEGENQMQAATKIQAAFRGYKVRKDKKGDIKGQDVITLCSESSITLENDPNFLLQDMSTVEITSVSLGTDDSKPRKGATDFDEKHENSSETKISEQFLSGVECSFTNLENDDEEITDLQGEDAENTLAETEDIQWQSSDIYVKSASPPPSPTGSDQEINTSKQELNPSTSEKSELGHS